MDLFYVERYEEEQEKPQDEENLNKLFEKIALKKRNRKKEKNKNLAEKIANTTIRRQIKRKTKSQIVDVPDIDMAEFIDVGVSEAVMNAEKAEVLKTDKIQKDLPSSFEGFTVLGAENSLKKEKVTRVLPPWLAKPTVISTDLKELQTKVSSMKELDGDLRKKLKDNGVRYLFPVQAEIIPWLLRSVSHSSIIQPRDICVSAPTGSGKTLAFVLPVIQALKSYFNKKIRALVVLPTQDLALQVFKTFKLYCKDTKVDVCFITRGNDFASEQKILINEVFPCRSKADIVVCTAGRLVDHLKHTKNLDLQDLEFLIIDEADRVLDNIQNDWLYHLENHLQQGRIEVPKDDILLKALKKFPPQKLLFSATLSQDPEKLQKIALFKPKLFTSVVEGKKDNIESEQKATDSFIGKYTTPNELTEKYIVCPTDIKPLILYKFIKIHNLTRTIVFTNSITEAHRLCILLRELFRDELKVVEMNSHLLMKNRKEFISEFSKGNIDIIICTDTLARGIDLPEVQCVISYSAPKHLKTYIHRAGRTARAGTLGTAVTLLNTTQVGHFKSLLEHAEKNNVLEVNIPTDDMESLEETYKKALEQMKRILSKEEEDHLSKIKSTKHKPGKKRKRINSVNSN
ncbi:probable ATP-dependent RNA helicase Dbp73D [Coccinella septempunctata]|uniref:probable ATP-dependent RNA helicase Dbp73D n=1 Tax=Coccinella septempunctata TaxID=41139 RepID=UPI001D07CFB5|nr:probable ATP-dependent RNA helicase Dbp73D [Coccinella septempunctata]